jgi:hypothetical protein
MTTTTLPVISCDEKHIYRVNGMVKPGLTEILKAVGVLRFAGNNQAAMNRGKAVHLATYLLDRGELDWSSVTDDWMPFVTAYEDCLREKNLTPILETRELPLYAAEGYCTTIDGVYRDAHGLLMCEIKTGDNPPDHVDVQTAAQLRAIMPYNKDHFGAQLLRRRAYILLRGNGTYDFKELKDWRDDQIWLSCLNVYRRITR